MTRQVLSDGVVKRPNRALACLRPVSRASLLSVLGNFWSVRKGPNGPQLVNDLSRQWETHYLKGIRVMAGENAVLVGPFHRCKRSG